MTYEKIKGLLKDNAGLIMPFMLSVILSMAVYAVYLPTGQVLAWTMPIVIVNLLLFAFCGFIKKHNFIGGLLMGVVVLAALNIFARLISGGDYGLTFQRWLLTGSEQVATKDNYLLALMVSFVPFFSVVVYYFADVLYRMMFLTLLSIVPFALYVKVLSEINNIYLCLIALLNVMIFLVHSRSEREKKTLRIGSQAAVLSAVLFVFVLLVVSSAIPKDTNTKYYDRFEALFMDSNFQAELNGDYTHFSEMSGDAGRYRNFASRRLYTVGIDQGVSFPPYFKRQTFDFFDFTTNRWHSQGSDRSDISYTPEEWTEISSKTSLSGLRSAIIRADELQSGFADKYNMRKVVEFDKMDDSIHSLVVTSENFSAMYYLSPSRIVGIRNFGGRTMDDVGVTKSGVFRFRDTPHRPRFSYVIDYYDELMARSYWFSMGGSDITPEDEDQMLAEMYKILSDNGETELAENVAAFIYIRDDAYQYQTMTAENTSRISKRVSDLAHEITDQYDYEWEKANALATYFLQNDFRYDLEYISQDDSPEYFLFTSKRGSCSDYAAAYVLMARSVGLTARYCEGYSADPSTLNDIHISEDKYTEGDPEVDVNKVFVVKDSGSHAYPEVFVPNIGWTVFEPTVPSDYSTITTQGGGVLANMSLDISLVLVVVVISGFILLIVILGVAFVPVIIEKVFIDRLMQSEPDSSAVLAYERVRTQAGRLVKNADAHTAYELSEEVDRKTGSDFTPVAFMLERIVYGGGHADQNDKKTIIERYIEVRRKIKEYIKNNAKAERKKYR